jgi:hypothetical protein
MTAYRILSPTDPRLTRTVRTLAWAEEWAARFARLVGRAEIQRRDASGAWRTVGTRTKPERRTT